MKTRSSQDRQGPSDRRRNSSSGNRTSARPSRLGNPARPEPRGPGPETDGVRLQKILSQAGVASRRAAEKLIVEGRVSVNGKTVLELGTKAAATDDIRVDGRRIRAAER